MSDFSLDAYQAEAKRTAPRDPDAYPPRIKGDADSAAIFDRVIWSLGLTGEAGEFADLMKKVHGHGHELDLEKAKKELGDVLWYLAVLADSLGLTLSEVAKANVAKLRARYPDGFTVAASKHGGER